MREDVVEISEYTPYSECPSLMRLTAPTVETVAEMVPVSSTEPASQIEVVDRRSPSLAEAPTIGAIADAAATPSCAQRSPSSIVVVVLRLRPSRSCAGCEEPDACAATRSQSVPFAGKSGKQRWGNSRIVAGWCVAAHSSAAHTDTR
jgi:hypothetical protein